MRHVQHLRRLSAQSCAPLLSHTAGARWLQTTGCLQATGDEVDQHSSIFDRAVKRSQRNRAALFQDAEDPLLAAVTDNLLDRLDDCRGGFSTVAIVGGPLTTVVRRLAASQRGVSELLVLDDARIALQRAERLVQVRFLEADAEFLPLREKSVDEQFSTVELVAGKLPGAMTQMRRALKPDGLLLAAMWGGDTMHELRASLTLAEQELEGGISQRTSPLAQVRDAGNLLTRAGFAIPSVDTDDVTVHYSSPMHLVQHLRAMGESNAVKHRRPRLPRPTWEAACSKYAELFGGADGSFPATYQAIYMTGWAPATSQARAAPRGSASVSFDDLEKTMSQLPSKPES